MEVNVKIFGSTPAKVAGRSKPAGKTLLSSFGFGSYNKKAFTLAEVLITLGIIGVVAAITLPSLITNIQSKVKMEQIRTAKYKFTLATDKMNSLGLIHPYHSTEDFIKELQKHLKLAKVCDLAHIKGCWPTDVIMANGRVYEITEARTGKQFLMPSNQYSDYSSPNVGIVTADGIPMILSFNTKCDPLDEGKQYPWSTSDNKPVSNATAGCIAGMMDINGSKGPNKIGEDIILFNATGFGSDCAINLNGKCYSAPFIPQPMTKSDCQAAVADGSLGIQGCHFESDVWAGVVRQCGGVDKLPSLDDLAKIATAIYIGNPNIGSSSYAGNLTFNYIKAAAWALPEPEFMLWSGIENDDGKSAKSRTYQDNKTIYGSVSQRINPYYGVCLGEP